MRVFKSNLGASNKYLKVVSIEYISLFIRAAMKIVKRFCVEKKQISDP